MTSRAPSLDLADHSGEHFARIHTPIHAPGFKAYCPVCGIGLDSEKEAEACCAALSPATERRIRTGHERRRGMKIRLALAIIGAAVWLYAMSRWNIA